MKAVLNRKTSIISLNSLLVIPVLLPPLVLLFLIANFATNVPFFDEWDFAPLVVKLHSGNFTLGELWAQHNEHRILFLRLILLGLAKIFGWNVTLDMFISFGIAIASLIILWRLMAITLPARLVLPALFLSSLLLFSSTQAENWLWAWQLCWFLVNCMVLLALWAVTRWPGKGLGFGLALTATIVASYTLAGGILLWPIILVGMFIRRKLWGWGFIIGWSVASVFFSGLYFYGYTPNSSSDLLYILTHPIDALLYVLAYLGAPLLVGIGTGYAVLGGAVGIITLILIVVWLWLKSPVIQKLSGATEFPPHPPANDLLPQGEREQLSPLTPTLSPRRREGATNPPSPILHPLSSFPWFQLVFFALANAGITTVGRLKLGIEQSLSSRYITGSNLFWIALIALIAIVVGYSWQVSRRPARIAVSGIAIAVAALVFLGIVLFYGNGIKRMGQIMAERHFGLSALYDYSSVPPDPLLSLYHTPQFLKQQAWSLDQFDEGPFQAASIKDYKESLKKYSSDQYLQYTYPADLMKITMGDVSEVRYNSSSLDFNFRGKSPVNIYIDGAVLNKNRPKNLVGGWNEQTLIIHSNSAYLVLIYWDTGKGLSEAEKTTLYEFDNGENQKVFITNVPEAVKAFRVDLYYKSGTLKAENFKLDLFNKK